MDEHFHLKKAITGPVDLKEEALNIICRGELEVEELYRAIDKTKIKTYTQLEDAGNLINSCIEQLEDIASTMIYLGLRMEGEDQIDG